MIQEFFLIDRFFKGIHLHFKTDSIFNYSLSFYNRRILGLVLGMSASGKPPKRCDSDEIPEKQDNLKITHSAFLFGVDLGT